MIPIDTTLFTTITLIRVFILWVGMLVVGVLLKDTLLYRWHFSWKVYSISAALLLLVAFAIEPVVW